jgi:alpha-beta hydrolase superfamily lysophospholipase
LTTEFWVSACAKLSAALRKTTVKKLLSCKFSFKRIVFSAVLLYLILMVFAWLFSERLMFVPPQSSYEDTEDIIKIQVTAESNISAIHLQAPDAEYTVLYCHGNAEDIGQLKGIFELFVKNGFSVFAFDYSGYGTSDGRATEKKIYREAEACYDYLVGQKQIPPEKIIALGRSLGGAPALHIASRRQIAGLILESSFVSAFRAVTRVPLLPFDKCSNLEKLKTIHCPVLVIHGKKDRIITLWHGQKLFDTANEPKRSFWVEHAGHNDLFWTARDKYWDVLEDFKALLLEHKQKNKS